MIVSGHDGHVGSVSAGRRLGSGALVAMCVAAMATGTAWAQRANRTISSNDIRFQANSDGTWTVRARALLANTAAAPANLSATLAIGLNGQPIGTFTRSVMVDGGGSCTATCAAQPGCLMCLPSVIPGLACLCYSRSIESGPIVVASLQPGDVITATVTAADGSVVEEVTSDDWGYQVVPHPIRHNRVMDASTLRYERSPSGGFMITGEIGHVHSHGTSGNLSSDVLVLEGGVDGSDVEAFFGYWEAGC